VSRSKLKGGTAEACSVGEAPKGETQRCWTEEHKNVRPTEAQVSDERTIRQRGAQKVQPDAREPVQAARLEANNCVSTSSAT
jgi:hypothetical protein